MAGWSHRTRLDFEDAFYEFLRSCKVQSKDAGSICLGDNLFMGQKRFYTSVFDGMEEDKHDFYVLKSRQLGISTATRALSIFWLGLHDGLRGALVFDTSPHKEEARAELVTMLGALPPRLGFPKVIGQGGRGNRDSLGLVNDSRMQFLSAGVKKSKSSGTLGRSSGLTLSHASELCSWDNDEGLKSYRQSLSEVHPNRLYIWESTARGFNMWYDMWTDAREDPAHAVCLFLGWYCKDSQRIDRTHPDFDLYGTTPPTDKEAKKIAKVRELYDVEITPEQLAWIRRKLDPTATSAGDAEADYDTDDNVMLAEQAWDEDEAFQQTGAIFFGSEKLTDLTNKTVSNKFKTYMYVAGSEFFDMRIWPASNARSVELKVWEEPEPGASYVLGIDPAFGENELNDRSSIEVLRCYADGVDQVAEYAWPLVNTRQFAWVIASLLGWYGSPPDTKVKYALELNGPGTAVFNELRSLKHQIDSGYQQAEFDARGLRDIFRNVRTYIYTRADAMGAGTNFHIKTNTQLKIQFLERLRDFVSNGSFRIRSLGLIEEMKTIAREGDSIKAPGSMKDDRVLSASFAIHCWETGPRKELISQKRTRAAEEARKSLSVVDRAQLFSQNQLQAFFDQKRAVRNSQALQLARQQWRYRR